MCHELNGFWAPEASEILCFEDATARRAARPTLSGERSDLVPRESLGWLRWDVASQGEPQSLVTGHRERPGCVNLGELKLEVQRQRGHCASTTSVKRAYDSIDDFGVACFDDFKSGALVANDRCLTEIVLELLAEGWTQEIV